MKIVHGEAETLEVDPADLDRGDHMEFPCGCRVPYAPSVRKDDGESWAPPDVKGVHRALDYRVEEMPLDCPAVWDLIGSGKTKGLFQLESSLGKGLAKKLQPRIFEHLAALMAISRPGCLKSRDEDGLSMTDRYCLCKNDVIPVKLAHPSLESSLGKTYGVLVYQEQAMQIARDLAGFDLKEADVLRKAIGKKDTVLMAKTKALFLEKAKGHGVVDEEAAVSIFENIEKSQRYSFNKCNSFDTKVLRASPGKHSTSWSPLTVEEMYKIRHDLRYAQATGHEQLRRKWKRLGNYGKGLSLASDGRIRPNLIEDIQPAGIRPVYKVVVETGASHRVTDNHRFPTPDGERMLSELKVGDLLYLRGGYEKTTKTYAFSNMTRDEIRARDQGKVNNAFGQANWLYTNGSYSLFEKNKLLLAPECRDCGQYHRRIETHHIDGDRSNSSLENLVNLCPSCHKKREYAAGRTRRGQKGYPAKLVAITSIEPDGECMTYDVTMAGPDHNFAVEGGLITSNSHAVSYAMDCYWSAHWKAHFPLYFFVSYLYWAQEKSDPLKEMRQLVNDARHFGVVVTPPRFSELRNHFGVDDTGVSVTFGLADVRGIGDKAVDKMKVASGEAVGKLGPMMKWSWYDFLTKFSDVPGATVVRRMIEVGAMRDMPHHRQRMLAEFDAWGRLTDKEKEEVLGLGGPLYQWEAAKQEYTVEEPKYSPKAMKEYKAARAVWDDYMASPEMQSDGRVPPPCPEHPPSTGMKLVKKSRAIQGEDGKPLKEIARDALGEPVVIDPARSADNLEDALRGILARQGSITKGRVDKVQSLLDLLVRPPFRLEDTPAWIAKVEEENLGVPLTCSHVQSADRSIVNCTVRRYLDGWEPRSYDELIVLGVEVQEVFEHVIRNGEMIGRKMGRLVVADDSGLLEDVVCFPDAWDVCSMMLHRPNAVVGLGGKRSYKDKQTFIVEKVWEI